MSWKAGNHACFLMLSTLLTIVSPAVYGESLSPSERVTSVVPNLSGGSITIATTAKNPLPAPLIQYLPGPDGKTLLVADFEGVSYQLPTHLLKPENTAPDAWRQTGIQEIRIGQFSSQPPTMRITIGAFNARAFRTLAFHARPGALIMKWTPGYPSPSSKLSPSQANRSGSLKASPSTTPLAPAEVASLAPDYRHAAAPNSAALTAYSTRSGKNIIADSAKKPGSIPTIAPERLAERPGQGQADKNKWLAKTASNQAVFAKSKGDEVILYKSTNATAENKGIWESASEQAAKQKTNKDKTARKDAAIADEEPLPKPQSAVARWLKILPGLKAARQNGEETNPLSTSAPAPAPQRSESADMTPPRQDDGAVIVSLNDVEQAKDNGTTSVLVKTDKRLDYKAFRLHEPERYVIDFDGLPALESAPLPSVENELLIKGIRTGTPDDSGLTQRLVLDLKDNTVDVQEQLCENGTALSLMVRPSASSPLPAHLKAQLVKDKLIVLDAGHGGSDPGAQRAGVSEKDLTLQITNQLKKRLTQLGARVVMTRTDDTFISLEDRVKITNDAKPDLFVSIHINALESTSDIYGIETYYQTDQSRPLASAIHQQLVEGLGVPDRSIRKARFYVINHTAVPAILAEVGFISNQKERDNLGASEYQVKIADSLSAGIVGYLTEKQALAGRSGKEAF